MRKYQLPTRTKPAYNACMKKLTLLGGITPSQFFEEYWHKKPLLIRQAIPGFTPPIPPQELFKLAAEDDVESRLISFFGKHWELQHGPFQTLPVEQKKDWTVLVQGVNLHRQAADDLLRQFNFVPNTRLDDLMISYAADGGGVGPHFDSYDVFLLQAHGQRRWQISTQKDLTLVEGMPLKILRNFKAEQEFILEPGDMLYLPPHCAHDGIALGECMTYSIGFRSPSFQEIGESFLHFMHDTIELPGRYADPHLKAGKFPAEINTDMLEEVAQQIRKIQFTDEDITIFLGEYLTEPKSSVFFSAPEKALTPKRFIQSAQKKGVRLSLKSQMLYKGKHVFLNGESFVAGRADKTCLLKLANLRQLSAEDVQQASDDVLEALCTWYEDGWLHLAE
jgi:50S ribosomal protein L16 3-hydroxylase